MDAKIRERLALVEEVLERADEELLRKIVRWLIAVIRQLDAEIDFIEKVHRAEQGAEE